MIIQGHRVRSLLTFTRTEDVGMCLVQRLPKLEVCGGDVGSIRPANRSPIIADQRLTGQKTG